MGLNKTEFLPGVYLSYPLESLPRLFAVVETVSRKAFFEKISELDKKGGEGLSIDKIIEMIWIGLQAENPGVTIEDAKQRASQFYDEYGQEALELRLVDAFADAKLTDKTALEKRRNLVLELRDLELQRMEYIVKAKTRELQAGESNIKEEVGPGNLNLKPKTPELSGIALSRKRSTRTTKKPSQTQKKK